LKELLYLKNFLSSQNCVMIMAIKRERPKVEFQSA
jgi:hypothetical protein